MSFASPCVSRIDLVLSRKAPNLIGGIGGIEMAKQVVCPPCGEVIRGDSDDELVTNVISHAKNHGHELGDTDRAEILSGATEV
jgi:predicted small metal-binding protein